MKLLGILAVCFFCSSGYSFGVLNNSVEVATLNQNDYSSESEKAGAAAVPDAVIGYVNEDDEFVAISKQELETFFQNTDFISTEVKIEEYEVVEGEDAEGGSLFIVRASAKDGDYSIRMNFQLEPFGANQFALGTTGCKCKSTGCTTWGCNVSEFGPCSCSDCGNDDGTCEKTSYRIASVTQSLFSH